MVAFRVRYEMIKLSKDIVKLMKETSALRYPNEACGFILSKNGKSFAIEVENESPEKETQFLINPHSYVEAMKLGDIIGVWHSHVDEPPTPSQADIAGCNVSGLQWFIVAIDKLEDVDKFEFSEIVTLNPNQEEIAPIVGRPYVFGVFDCWSLVVDYMQLEFNIKLNRNYPRIEEFWLKDQPLLSKHYQDENLVIANDELRVGDILTFQTDNSGEANHVGVYVGDNKILHHVFGRLSKHDIYGGYWEKHTVLHLRHKDLC